jgi:acyl carrier protein
LAGSLKYPTNPQSLLPVGGMRLAMAERMGSMAGGYDLDLQEPAARAAREKSVADLPPPARAAALDAWLREAAARILEMAPGALAADRSLIALGLDSLGAAELAAEVSTELGIALSPDELLAGPSLAELGAMLAARLAAGAEVSDAAASGAAGSGAAASGGAPSGAAAGTSGAAAGTSGEAAGGSGEASRHAPSFGQRALWLTDRLDAASRPAYVLAGAARVDGDLEGGRLFLALKGLLLRHAALRTRFVGGGDGEPVAVVGEEAACEFTEEDAGRAGAPDLGAWLAAEAYRPFDLAEGPLVRCVLLHRALGGDAVLLLAVHHVVADFWSLGVMLGELGALYAGAGAVLPALPCTFADHARAEAARLAGPEGARLAAHWRQALLGAPAALELPTDRPRPARQTFAGGVRQARFGRELSAALAAASRAAGATPFMALLAAYMVVLHRHSGQQDLVVATPTAGRAGGELAGLVGYFVNPVVVRGAVAGEAAFAAVLAGVRQRLLAAFAHQGYPFALLAERQEGERDASRSPVFQTLFVLYRERQQRERGLGALALGIAGVPVAAGELRLASLALPRQSSQLDLGLQMAEIDGALAAALEFNRDLFDAATAERLLGHLGAVLAAVAPPAGGDAGAAPAVGELPLLSAAERQQLREWNDTPETGPAVGIHQLFEWQAAPAPQAVAVAGQGGRHTYRELEERRRTGWRATAGGPGRGAGGAGGDLRRADAGDGGGAARHPQGRRLYVPLDPAHPAERLALVLGDSAPSVLVTERGLAGASRCRAPGGAGEGAPGRTGREWRAAARAAPTWSASTASANGRAPPSRPRPWGGGGGRPASPT